jgi:HAD superfamily hydrolase (TIGR01509 family)
VQGVPDSRPLPSAAPPPRPVDGVLFDFHGTIAQVEDPVDWVIEAALRCGVLLDHTVATSLADRLLLAGRAGGPRPVRVPPHLAEVYADRDMAPRAHRAAYAGLAATVSSGIDGLPEALYDRLLDPGGWRLYTDALPTLQAIAAADLPVAVVSNVGFDLRPLAHALGIGEYVTDWVLSFELGRCKPDPAIFSHACTRLGITPERALMVGDTAADAAAVEAGCRVLILPAGKPGTNNGLTAVLSLILG